MANEVLKQLVDKINSCEDMPEQRYFLHPFRKKILLLIAEQGGQYVGKYSDICRDLCFINQLEKVPSTNAVTPVINFLSNNDLIIKLSHADKRCLLPGYHRILTLTLKGTHISTISQESLNKLLCVFVRETKYTRARELKILEMRYAGNTLKKIGDSLGISTERVRQIHYKAIRRRRKQIDLWLEELAYKLYQAGSDWEAF